MLPTVQTIKKALIKNNLSHCTVVKNTGDINIGWLLPDGYAISARTYDHKEILYALGLDYRGAFEESMVKKALDRTWECTDDKKSLDTLKDDLMINLTTYNYNDILTVEIVNLSEEYLFHSVSKVYQFSVEDFKRQDYRLEKVFIEKYRTY